jgi:hypothetical protein
MSQVFEVVAEPTVSIHNLLGNAQTFPTWLDPERFLQTDFHSDQVLLDLRRFVSRIVILQVLWSACSLTPLAFAQAPLATLHNELNDYLTLLKSKVI